MTDNLWSARSPWRGDAAADVCGYAEMAARIVEFAEDASAIETKGFLVTSLLPLATDRHRHKHRLYPQLSQLTQHGSLRIFGERAKNLPHHDRPSGGA